MQAHPPPQPDRLIFLDWLRILAFVLLVFYHVGMYYVSWDWHIKSPSPWLALENVMRLTGPWRMDLLFLVSGAATAVMLTRFGATPGWLVSRAKRLGLPLLLGMAIIVPPQSWLEVRDKLGYSGSFSDFMSLYLSGYGDFCFSPGRCLMLPTWNHLWFLPYLLVYTVLLWLALRAWPGLLGRAGQALAARLDGIGIVLWPVLGLATARTLLQLRFPDTRAMIDDWSGHTHYAAMFVAGAVAARTPRVWPRLAQLRWPALVLALLAWALMVALRQPGLAPPDLLPRPVWVLLCCTQQWCAIVAVLGLGFRHLNRDTPWRHYLTQAVFPLYVLHQTTIMLLAKAMLPLQWTPGPESVVLVVGTLSISVALFECARRVRWLAPWFGIKVAAARVVRQHLGDISW